MAPLSDTTLAYGREVITALLGVDTLYRAESGDDTGLAVLNMDTAGEFPPERFGGYPSATERLEELQRRAGALPEPDRRTYYDQLCASTLAFVEWRSRGLPFDAQLGRFLHVPVAPASDERLDALEARIHELLDGLGYGGSLERRCAAWEERNRVPGDAVKGTLDALMEEAWDRTEASLFRIPANRSDAMRVRTVTGVPFNARCDYLGRTVEINTDPVLTLQGLKHLAVHEGYPGHFVQFRLRETMVRAGTAAADALLSVVNSASSSVFEGIADAGLHMLDWIDGDEDRVQSLLNRHRAGIGTSAAWRLHALGWTREATNDWLRGRSLVGGEGWVENRMRFIDEPSRAVLIWSYWWGEPSVVPVWDRLDPARRPEFLTYLYGRMHGPTTVAMFDRNGGGAS